MKVTFEFFIFINTVISIILCLDVNKGRKFSRLESRSIQDVLDQEYWNEIGQQTLQKHLAKTLNTKIAKNIIIFLGDGMSSATITAARIYKGQLKGKDGEEEYLSFEEFPYIGKAKTYCVDKQVADSACSATAYLGGVKGNDATIGVTGKVKRKDCEAMRNVSNHVSSIGEWAQNAGKSTGFVTTTRVTHASPAGFYAHIADRGWEDDIGVSRDGKNASVCLDIAQQLILTKPGIDFNVVMGGGRRYFYPQEIMDAQGIKGRRRDGKNLIELWVNDKVDRKASYAYITRRSQLLTLKEVPDYILGLFASSHMEYHLEQPSDEPTLEEMTVAALSVLRKNAKGFVLFVEGGKIDLAHHDNLAKKALDETVEFAKAVHVATKLTNEDDTLIIATADHSHVMTLNGYAKKGNNIFGFPGDGGDGLPYTTLSYANGPGYQKPDSSGKRVDLRKVNTDLKSFRFPAMIPIDLETHGGDDVAVYARGPWSHLFSGTFEQNFIPHALGFASCLGKGLTTCHQSKSLNEFS